MGIEPGSFGGKAWQGKGQEPTELSIQFRNKQHQAYIWGTCTK